jgi:Zn-dependent protease with chaperone function
VALTAEQFEALVHECEGRARQDHQAYVRRTTALALAGYGYVWVVLAGLGSAIALLVWSLQFHRATYRVLALAAPLVLVFRVILRALWVPARPPKGVRVRRTDAPALFALIDRLARDLHAPRLHRVLLTEQGNAAPQIPRLGPLGWYRNYVILGFAEMQAMSPEEFQSVLAHELGHVSRQHGRFTVWIYRIRATWVRLGMLIEARARWGLGFFTWFVQRWGPYFNAYSFVLIREHEREADRFSASVTGKDAFARALGTSYITSEFLGRRFWPAVYRAAEKEPEPPGDLCTALASALGTGPADDDARRWLETALRRRTGLDDTHPALAERLSALGIVPSEVESRTTPRPTAAEHYLGERLVWLAAALDRSWRKRVARYWGERHRRSARRRTRLRAITEAAVHHDLEVAWERAEIVLDLDGEEPAMPLLRDVVSRAPHHARANFALGHILADRQDENAIPCLERAMVCDVQTRPAGHETIAGLLESMGREAEAVRHRHRAWEAEELLYRAARERGHVTLRDALLPHGLSSDLVGPVRTQLQELGGVRTAWLARKKVAHLPESPLFVLGIVSSTRVDEHYLRRIAARTQLPGQVLVTAAGPVLRRMLRRVHAARIL